MPSQHALRAPVFKSLVPRVPEHRWQLVADDHCCLELDREADAALLADRLRELHDWLDVVCGRRTVYVHFDLARFSQMDVLSTLGAVELPSDDRADPVGHIEIPACYDPDVAPDLLTVCEQLGLTREEFIAAHTGTTHVVDMLGFMPGFAYIGGLNPSLSVQRLDEPRQRVAAGSVGIAGRQTGIYPFAGPGGWRLIARTPLRLFDPEVDPPALLTPLQTVRFVPISRDEFEAGL